MGAGGNQTLCNLEDIGRHFSHAIAKYFIPNAQKEKEYPGDRRHGFCKTHIGHWWSHYK